MTIDTRIEMIRKIHYVTSDGTEFASQKDAEAHEFKTQYEKIDLKSLNTKIKYKVSDLINELEKLQDKYGNNTYLQLPYKKAGGGYYGGPTIINEVPKLYIRRS